MDQILEKLFESPEKVRILRLFLQNMEQAFTLTDVAHRTKTKPQKTRGELVKLVSIGLIKRRKDQYGINSEFALLAELKELVINASFASRKKLIQRIRGLGRIKLAVIAGTFLNNETSRTDLLIVGDDVKKRRIETFLSTVESELGKPVRYTLMDTDEYKYRINMYDRFLKDIQEFEHEKLINKR